MATEGLSIHHQLQVKEFLRFFRSKVEFHVKEIQEDFDDTITDRLGEDMYSRNDVVDILNSLSSATKSSVRTELQATVNKMTLLLRQIFETAEEHDVELDFDMSIIEDRDLLERVQNYSIESPVMSQSPLARPKVKMSSHSDEKVRKMEVELEELRLFKADQEALSKENDERITQTKQFKQLKLMIELKNETLRHLRSRLLQYEPDLGDEIED